MSKNRFEKLRQINCLTSEMDGLYHQASVKIGLSDSASRILYELYTSGGSCLLSHIYKNFGISKQTVNSALRKLENENLIHLKQHYGKTKMVFLTEQGKEKANETVSKLVDAEIGAFESWSEEEIDTYISLTNKYVETFCEQVNTLQKEQKL